MLKHYLKDNKMHKYNNDESNLSDIYISLGRNYNFELYYENYDLVVHTCLGHLSGNHTELQFQRERFNQRVCYVCVIPS